MFKNKLSSLAYPISFKMYAIVEFLNADDETSGEISIVPLLWVYKNETKCYWPIRTNKIQFPEFVKRLSPFKRSWPTYKIKLHFTTASYSAAEAKLQGLLTDVYDSTDSSRSLIQKQLQCLDSSGSDLEETSRKRSIEKALDRDKDLICVQGQNIPSSGTITPLSISSPDEILQGENVASDDNVPLSKKSRQDKDIASRQASDTPSSSRSFTDISFQSSYHTSDFESTVLDTLSRLMANTEQHSIILDEMLRHSRSVSSDKLIPPINLQGQFPLPDIDAFNCFEKLLDSDKSVWEYMVKRLAALGGSGLENLTRRILQYLMTNQVALLFNWKGRDKLSFENSKVMELILAATKINYSANEVDELKISNAVKDWLKYAKLRMNSKKKK